MANQYDVLGKAPGLEELNNLSPNDVQAQLSQFRFSCRLKFLLKFDLACFQTLRLNFLLS